MSNEERGIGKCPADHLGSFGYPTRPAEEYPFCPQCGAGMAWRCPSCEEPVPQDTDELTLARFCRQCGSSYFGEEKPAPGAIPARAEVVRDPPG